MHRFKPKDRPVSDKQLKKIVALGRQCCESGFPNPNRQSCPSRSLLRAMAHRAPQLSLNDLPLSHVIHCSPCFRDYRHFLRTATAWRVAQVGAMSLLVLGLCAGTAFLLKDRSGPSVASETRRQEAVLPKPETTNPSPGSAAPAAIRINLAELSPLRGNEGTQRARIQLHKSLFRALVSMPIGMEPGEYSVRLQDSAGTVHVDSKAEGRVRNGSTSIEIDLDLRAAATGRGILMVRPPSMSWRRFSVLIK
jgi:hypothetical protein